MGIQVYFKEGKTIKRPPNCPQDKDTITEKVGLI